MRASAAWGSAPPVRAPGPRHRAASSRIRAAAETALVALGLSLLSCQSTDAAGDRGPGFRVILAGLDRPVHLDAPPGDSRVFVLEQVGRVRIIVSGRLVARPFLDLTAEVRVGFEQGLLSIAFHPDYPRNGRFFVDYTDRNGDTRIVGYRVSSDPDVADPASAQPILRVAQPFSNHNGGLVRFGPDGLLYTGTGDGGSANDPRGHAQNLRSLLGKMLRIDVDHRTPYAVPSDNPFAGRLDVAPEIWAFGLRNPWRFSFDVHDSLLYIADVGQNQWEEIDVVPLAGAGYDFGWNVREGSHCFRDPGCVPAGRTDPVLEYSHTDGCSVTGGSVYRGRAMPDARGHYFYGDYCRGWIRSFRYRGGRVADPRTWPAPRDLKITSFGTDGEGEMYVLSEDGRVLKLVDRGP